MFAYHDLNKLCYRISYIIFSQVCTSNLYIQTHFLTDYSLLFLLVYLNNKVQLVLLKSM
jgi:hypothetical protein